MKKRNYIPHPFPTKGTKRSLPAWLLTVLLLALLACNDSSMPNDPNIQGENVNIDLSVRFGLKDGKENGTEAERKVTSLRVYAFHANGYKDKMKRETNPAGLAGVPYTLQMTVLTGKKIFAVIGNEPAALTAKLDAVGSLHELRKVIQKTEHFTFNTAAGGNLPFASVSEEKNIDATDNAPIAIALYRAVARAEMHVIKDLQNPNVVKLVSMQVKNTPKESYLTANETPLVITSGLLEDLEIENFSNALVGSATTDTLKMKPRYLFEHLTGKNDPPNPNRTVIQLVLDNNGTPNIYNVPIRVTNTQGELFDHVLRNFTYQIRATVFPTMIKIDYTIDEWDDEAPWNKVPGTDDTNMKFTDWVDEPRYDWEIPG